MIAQTSPSKAASSNRFFCWLLVVLGVSMFLFTPSLSSFLIGLGFALPSGWWLWCDRKDTKANKGFIERLAEHQRLQEILRDTDPDVAEWVGPKPELQRTPRRWVIVGPAAAICLVLGASASSSSDSAGKTTTYTPPTSTVTQTVAPPTATETAQLFAPPTTEQPPQPAYTPPPAAPQPDVQPEQAPPAQVAPPAEPPASTGTYYASCREARAAGAGPFYRGQPGYRDALDRDGDGIACDKVA
ncbi:Excalibur calcium-binding domain protein [Corynebacterium heidelbergense]|nr:Excalibur calcium-binding domain protein [Corynebacterium heidelbergense]